MTQFYNIARWLPLTILIALAISFEPIRSGFELANQSCEFTLNWERVQSALSNKRHIIGYGSICLVAAVTLRKNRLLLATTGTFLFSVLLEVEQSFFRTGHCRVWDLIPNVLGIVLAAAIFLMGKWFVDQARRSK